MQAEPKRWPFMESPGAFAARLEVALEVFGGSMIAAVRNVLIENPPTFAAPVVPPGAQEAKPVYQIVGDKEGWLDVDKIVYDNRPDYSRRTLYTAPVPTPAARREHNYRVEVIKALHRAGVPFADEHGNLMSSPERIKWLADRTAPVPATTPVEQPEGAKEVMKRAIGEIARHDIGAAIDIATDASATFAPGKLCIIDGCGLPATGFIGACPAHTVEFKEWKAARATATNTNQPEGEKGGAA